MAGLVIGLVYGAIGLLSGFCLMSSLRGWWADGDTRLVRSYALAIGGAIAATQALAAAGLAGVKVTPRSLTMEDVFVYRVTSLEAQERSAAASPVEAAA